MNKALPFRVWFRQEPPSSREYTVRYVILGGIGALQLRPGYVTTSTQATGQMENLSAEELRRCWLLYQIDEGEWQQVALWPAGVPLSEGDVPDRWEELMPETPQPLPPEETAPTDIEPRARQGRMAVARALESARPRLRRRGELRPLPALPAPAPAPEEGEGEAGAAPQSPLFRVQEASPAIVRHLRRVNERLLQENEALRARLAELEARRGAG